MQTKNINLVELNNNLSSIGNQIIGRFFELSCLIEEDECKFNHIGPYEFESDSCLGGINLYIDFKDGNVMDKKIKKTGTVESGSFKISLKEGFVSWNHIFNIIDFGMCQLSETGISMGELKVVEDENEIGKYCIKSFVICN
jgi:hypothetical protein